jgi:multiple sugar transport system permease protein
MLVRHSVKIRKNRPGLNRSQRTNLAFYGFITPWLLGFIFLTVIPLLISLALSFTNYDGLNWGSLRFMAFNNYTRAFTNEQVGHSLQRTSLWLALYLPMWMVISFGLALLLHQN